jgi:hypothetical protein
MAAAAGVVGYRADDFVPAGCAIIESRTGGFLGLAPLLALRAAISARNSIRTRAWWLAMLFAALALVLSLWSIGLWLEYFKEPAT